jgi:DNA modification methylase
MWLNLGDSYAAHGGDGKPGRTAKVGNTKSGCQKTTNKIVCGLKQKDLVGIPWMTAFALRADGWYLRSDVIWNKPNCMPESVRDRPTKSHEYVFLMTKNAKYYYDAAAIKERSTCKEAHRGHTLRNSSRPSRGSFSNIPEGKTYPMKNKRDVWRVPTQSYPGAHYAVFPEKLVEPCIMAGCPIGGVVLDPFMGSGTVGVVSLRLKRNYVGVDLNPEYIKQAQERIYRGCKPLDKFDNEEVKKSVSITL